MKIVFDTPLDKQNRKLLLKFVNKKNKKEKVSNVLVQKYMLSRDETLSVKNLKKVENLLPYKLYSKQQKSERFKHRLGISIYKKYKIISTELKNRLYVKDPIDDIMSATDIDKDFCRFIDGRPLKNYIPVFKSRIESINKLLQIKQFIGIKKDCVLNIEMNFRNETSVFNLAVKRLTNQVKCLDKFISEDYQKSMSYLTDWDKLRNQIDLKINELQNVAAEKFTIRSKLIGLEYKYGLQQKYGRFLYYLSPATWRSRNREFARSVEIEAKGFDFDKSNEEDTFAVIFERMRKICNGPSIKPVLYFTQPKDIMDVFDAMETQQLHYYTHVNHLTPFTKLLKNRIKSLKEVITQDSASVTSCIKSFENLLQFSEERCDHLESRFYKILYGLFYNTVAESDVLKLTLHLQFCYERVLLEKPMNMDIKVVAKSLERTYMYFTKNLDAIKSDAVRLAMSKCIEMERLKVKRANNASRELRLFYRLERELLRSYGIRTDIVYKSINKVQSLKKNKVIDSKNYEKEIKKKSLTEAELEYLRLFTDWTENEDPGIYLQSLNINDNPDDESVRI